MLNLGATLSKNLKLIIGIVVILVVLSLESTRTRFYESDVHSQNLSTATNSETISEDKTTIAPATANPQVTTNSNTTNSNIEYMVPYSKTSIWNTPIDFSPKYDPYSDEMIATLELANQGQFTSDPDIYSFTLYFVDENTPRWDIPCLVYKCTIMSTENTFQKTESIKNVPIPIDAQPAAGTDANMIIVDKTTYTEYNLHQVKRTETGWEVRNASVYNILWDGTPLNYGSRGAGLPYYAGLIRPWEIVEGKIEHALTFGYSEPALDKCVYPAAKTNGDSTLPFAIPEGARLQLDPTLTDADFERMGLDRTGKIIAKAMQEYGLFLVENGGSIKIHVEDLINNPYATQQWTDPELNLTSATVSKIPFTSFRVLELPPGYWESSEQSQSYGKCFAFPGAP